MTTTKNGRPLYKWRARFWARDSFDRPVEKTRDIMAVCEFQARKKAEGIAEKEKWKFASLGRA